MKRGPIINFIKYISVFLYIFINFMMTFPIFRATFTGFGSTGFRFKREHPDSLDDLERWDFS